MDYVMVPVPEEYADEVTQYMARRKSREEALQALGAAIDEQSIAHVFDRSDNATRSLLVTVARETLEGEDVSIASVAAAFRCSAREVVGMALELNYFGSEVGGPLAIMMPRGEAGTGEHVWDQQMLVMSETVARLVISVAAARTASAPEAQDDAAG